MLDPNDLLGYISVKQEQEPQDQESDDWLQQFLDDDYFDIYSK